MNLNMSGVYNKYIISHEIGRGGYSVVKEAKNIKTGEKVAIKIIDTGYTDDDANILLEREKSILRKLKHPNIVELKEIIEDEANNITYIVMEHVSGGDLFSYVYDMGRLKESEARTIFRQIICALEYCHSKLIIHRDLKLENILVDNKLNVKIIDFGLSNYLNVEAHLKTSCGSLIYAAPEILMGHEYMGPAVDVWSLGVILYTIINGHQPWRSTSLRDIIKQSMDEEYDFIPSVSQDCRDLILRMLTFDGSRRITIPEIREHSWTNKEHKEPIPNYIKIADEFVYVHDEHIIKTLNNMGYRTTPQLYYDISRKMPKLYVAMYYSLLHKKQERERHKRQHIHKNSKKCK